MSNDDMSGTRGDCDKCKGTGKFLVKGEVRGKCFYCEGTGWKKEFGCDWQAQWRAELAQRSNTPERKKEEAEMARHRKLTPQAPRKGERLSHDAFSMRRYDPAVQGPKVRAVLTEEGERLTNAMWSAGTVLQAWSGTKGGEWWYVFAAEEGIAGHLYLHRDNLRNYLRRAQ